MTYPATYDELFRLATANHDRQPDGSFEPYDYQRRIAEDGFPEVLDVPTGCGKTLAVVVAWLWRRRFAPDPAVRRATPRRLVYVLPQRVLVEQIAEEVRRILDVAGSGDVRCSVLMGGEGGSKGDWRLHPEDDAILVATQDMALSAALNRRYGESRWTWPVEYGLLNNDCHFVFDEIQLMGPALPTSRQLHGLRLVLGTALPCTSTWMSATVDDDRLATVDAPTVASRMALSDKDRSGPLSKRLDATRTIHRVPVAAPKSYVEEIAAAVAGAHRPGTRTIAVCNTVARATDLYRAIKKLDDGPDLVLIHSRFRPDDRREHLQRALAEPDADGPGAIVVTTQVLEAGVDITSDVLFTEAAPWSSIVQRAGRCNRDGKARDATLLWADPPKPAPYGDIDVGAAADRFDALEAQSLSTEQLLAQAPTITGPPVIHQVLRRRDVLELFDTLPDLSGSDIDISRFIRDADDRDIAVAWLAFDEGRPDPNQHLPRASARCPVPIADKKHLAGRGAWRFDHLAVRDGPGDSKIDGAWVKCRSGDLRPGMVVVLDSTTGGYDPEIGWAPKSRAPVDPIDPVLASDADDIDPNVDTAVGNDPLSMQRPEWVSLTQHLADVELEATAIDAAIEPPGLSAEQRRAAILAARLHDLGKAHPVFVDTLRAAADDPDERVEADRTGPPWAKSGGSRSNRHARPFFRHELASALALLDDGHVVIDSEAEKDLIIYLVAAHHGRIRLGFRSLPGEYQPRGELGVRTVALGIVDGEMLPEVQVPGATVPASMLHLSVMRLGNDAAGNPSWAARMLPLRDRSDLGPFRLGYLEALVRMADWRASASPGASVVTVDSKEQA